MISTLFLKNKTTVLFGSLIILIIYLPFIIIGQDSHIQIHDNLDCDFIYQHLLKQTGNLFNLSTDAIIPNVMNGLNASFIHSNFNFLNLFFLFFPSYWAYIFNAIVVRIIGFTGVWLLGKDYFKSTDRITLFLISLVYALLAARSIYGITIFGLPILFWAFLNLKSNQRIALSYGLIVFYAFYSHFVLIGPFILMAIFLYLFLDKSFKKQTILGLGLLIAFYLIFNADFIINYLGGELTHRSAWEYNLSYNSSLFKNTLINFFIGHTHTASIVVLPLLLLSPWYYREKQILFLLVLYFLLCMFYGFETVLNYFSSLMPLISGFDISRFSALKPIIYLVIFLKISQIDSIPKRLFYIVLIIQLIFNFVRNRDFLYNSILQSNIDLKETLSYYNNHLIDPLNNLVSLTGQKTFFKKRNTEAKIFSYNDFFDEDLYTRIKIHINKDVANYRVINLGLPPAVTQYNGFYTLDGFQVLYPLAYKEKMILANGEELNKPFVKGRLGTGHGGGHYCFLYSNEFIQECKFPTNVFCKSNLENFSIKNLEINVSQLKSMGANYLLSVVPIQNIEKLELELDKTFFSKRTDTKIFLYKFI